MEIIKKNDVPFVQKEHGTDTRYYIFPEHEIHFNTIKPNTTQPWHAHKKVDENILVTKGTIHVLWHDKDGNEQNAEAAEGTLIRVGDSMHTIANQSSEHSEFIVFRFIPQGINRHEQIKNDKQNP